MERGPRPQGTWISLGANYREFSETMEGNFTWAFSSLSLVIKDEPRWFWSNASGSILPFACSGL